MPCTYYSTEELAAQVQAEIKNLRSLLCSAMGFIEGKNELNSKFIKPSLRNWWLDHKREDEQRVEAELHAEAEKKVERKKRYDMLKKEFE